MQPTSIWTPSKVQDRRAHEVSKAVNEYDERLGFGQNPDNGQWCIFMRQGTTEDTRGGDLPVLGFRDIPTVDEALRKLHETDARRRGAEILEQINRHNEEIQRKFEDAASDASGIAAEGFEHLMRESGMHPRPRIFVPRGVKNG